jgi:hypothetical protein
LPRQCARMSSPLSLAIAYSSQLWETTSTLLLSGSRMKTA